MREQDASSYDGSEFGPEITRNISDLQAAGSGDPPFGKFVEDVKAVLRRAWHPGPQK